MKRVKILFDFFFLEIIHTRNNSVDKSVILLGFLASSYLNSTDSDAIALPEKTKKKQKQEQMNKNKSKKQETNKQTEKTKKNKNKNNEKYKTKNKNKKISKIQNKQTKRTPKTLPPPPPPPPSLSPPPTYLFTQRACKLPFCFSKSVIFLSVFLVSFLLVFFLFLCHNPVPTPPIIGAKYILPEN